MTKKTKKTTALENTPVDTSQVFTPLQQMFISLFNGNIRETALACKMSMSYAQEIAAKTGVKQAIQTRHTKEYQPKILDRQELQAMWSQTIVDSSVEMKDRLKASELLGKSRMMFADTPVSKNEVGIKLLDAALKSEAFKIASIRLDAIIVKDVSLSAFIPPILEGEVIEKPGKTV